MSSPLAPPDAATIELAGLESIRFELAECSGLTVRTTEPGALTVVLAEATLQRLEVQAHAGSLDAARASLRNVEARLVRRDGRWDVQEARIEEIKVQGLRAHLAERTALGPQAGARLDALDAIEGTVRAHVTDALWFVDANIVAPMQGGRIDLDRVAVQHLGPDSTLGVGPGGIYVYARGGKRVELLALDDGVTDHVFDAGASNGAPTAHPPRNRVRVQAFAEAILARGRAAVRVPDSKIKKAFRRTRLSGDLRLGDGVLGTPNAYADLARRGDRDNRVEIASTSLADRTIMRLPSLVLRAAALQWLDKAITTGTVVAALEAHLIGLPDDTQPHKGVPLALVVESASVRDVSVRVGAIPVPPDKS